MPATEPDRAAAALERVVVDLQHEASRTIAGEEILDRLRPFAACARRPDSCAERDQRAAQVAALRVSRRAAS